MKNDGSFRGYQTPQATGAQPPVGAGYFQQSPGGANPAPVQAAGGTGFPRQPTGMQSAGYFQQSAPGQNAGAFQPSSSGSMNYGQAAGNPQRTAQPSGYATGYPQPQGFPQTQGYPQAPGYSQTQGYAQPQAYPQTQGYVQPQGYSQGQGYQPAQSYPPAQGTGQQPYPYQPQTGYPQASMPVQGYPPAGQPGGGGTFIPQTPYSQGYTSPGYQAQQAYHQGYNAYQQMGKTQPQPPELTGVPLNGGGYVPPPVPVRKFAFALNNAQLLTLSGVLLVLFAAGMFIPGLSVLKWLFLALAAATIAILWIRPLVERNKRLCYTIVFGVLAIVAAASMLLPASGRNGQNTAQASEPAREAQETAGTVQVGAGAVVADGLSGQVLTNVSAVPATQETPVPQEDSSMTDRLQSFFYYWSGNQLDEMLKLCSPNWQSQQSNPQAALFALKANRTPKDYTVEKVGGTADDESREVVVTSTMDKNLGKDPVKYRITVIMLKEDGQWYVDPKSLKSNETEQTTDPNVTATPGPTATPAVYPNTVLYYNPDGGELYHLDASCKKVGAKYVPMKGHFTYAEINDEQYKNLKPCSVCGAPFR